MSLHKITIDINADVGEGIGNDAQIMPYVSSCNIACGGHAGDEQTMQETIQLAKQHQVHIGAHPSFPDRDNFGRRMLTMTKSELSESIFEQLLHFFAVAEIEEVPVNHIKLHGALYNYAAIDAPTADAVVDAIIATKIRPLLYVPYHSILHKKAANLLPLAFEAFVDRRYTASGTLVSRIEKQAVIHDKMIAWQQLYRMVTKQEVVSNTNELLQIKADTYCVHGDHPNAISILQFIHQQMKSNAIALKR